MNGQYTGTVVDRLTEGRVVFKSRGADYATAQRQAERYAKRLGCGDRFAVRVLDRFAKGGAR